MKNGVGDVRVTETIEVVTTYSDNNLNVRIPNFRDLALFKNVNNLPNDYILAESTTEVKISLSYSRTNFEKSKSFRLYDSKCRECNKNSQATWLIDVSVFLYFLLMLNIYLIILSLKFKY